MEEIKTESAPGWAMFLAQDGDGVWYWHANKPKPNGATVCGEGYWISTGESCIACRGELLGDWRDTLERRPADLSEPAVTERLTEATQNVLAAVPALMDEKCSFEPEFMPVSVSNETVQLERPIAVAGTGNGSATESAFLIGRVIDLLRTSVDHFSADELAELNELTGAELTKRDSAVCGGQKYLDAHWFERGELPPVGLMCEIRLSCWNSEKYEKVTIVAITNEYLIVKYETFEQHYMLKDISFRPIRTERDDLIEMLADFDGSPASAGAVADAILAAGFSMGAK